MRQPCLAYPVMQIYAVNFYGMKVQWYQNAIIYALDVETFMDGNGEGKGDYQGLVSRLDYLSGRVFKV